MAAGVSYAKTHDDVWIAYETEGTGPIDLILVNSWVSHLEVYREQPRYVEMIERFAKTARVIDFDKRGTGLSDRISKVPNLDARMDDIRAVMDAAGSRRAVILGWGDGAALAALFAASHPDRAAGLILCGGNARMAWAADYPWGMTERRWSEEHARIPEIWGTERGAADWARMSLLVEPGDPDDPELLRWAAKWARYSAAPGGMLAFDKMWFETDVRDVLPAIQVPSLVIHPEGWQEEEAAWVAGRDPSSEPRVVARRSSSGVDGGPRRTRRDGADLPPVDPGRGGFLRPGSHDGPVHRHRRLDESERGDG